MFDALGSEVGTLRCGLEYVIYQNRARPFGINEGDLYIARIAGDATPALLPEGAIRELLAKAKRFAENYAFEPNRHHVVVCTPQGEHPFMMIVLPKGADTFTP